MEYAWGTHEDGTAYVAAWWPLALGVLGLVCMVIGSALVIRNPAGREKFSYPIIILGVFAALTVMICVAGAPLLVALEGTTRAWASKPFARTSWWELLPYILVGTGLMSVGTLVGGIAHSVHFARSGPKSGAAAAPGHAMLLMGLVLVTMAWVEGLWLTHIGPMPTLAISSGVERTHVAESLQITPKVLGKAAGDWTTHDTRISPTDEGEIRIELRATQPLVEIRRELKIEVGRDEQDPLFPLVVGNWWAFQHTSESSDRLLIFLKTTHEYVSEPHVAKVVDEKVIDGLHVYALQWSDPSSGIGIHPLYNWNGEVREVPDYEWLQHVEPTPGAVWTQVPAEQPVEDGQQPAEDTQEPTPPEETEPVPSVEGTPCTFTPFDGYSCTCLLEPAGTAQIPGPVKCMENPNTADDLKVLGSIMMGILTAGILMPGLESGEWWEMTGSGHDDTALPSTPEP